MLASGPAVDFISPVTVEHLIRSWGPWAVGGLVMLESVGLPLPGEAALVTAALYAGSTHRIDIVPLVLITAAGAILGDNIGYLIGRSVGLPLVARYGRYVGLSESRLKVGQYLFLRHGGKIVFFGRFGAILRTLAALLAGINRMPWRYFLLMNALGGVCWATLMGAGPYFFGEEVRRLAGWVSLLLLLAAVALMIAGFLFFRRHERELRRRAEAALPGPWYEGKGKP
jgi:membrane protein DedA with SNARE-associated domain